MEDRDEESNESKTPEGSVVTERLLQRDETDSAEPGEPADEADESEQTEQDKQSEPAEPGEPHKLGDSATIRKILLGIVDLSLAVVALFFFLFGGLVYVNDGSSAAPGSRGRYLYNIAKYGPTIFPVLFSAIVGGALKTFATWRMQIGTRIGLVEQLVGSNTVAGALFTQARLRAANTLALSIICLWALSPLGSQAALRAINIVDEFNNSTRDLVVLETFAPYCFGLGSRAVDYATRKVIPPAAAALQSVRMLESRNQDLWGNIRLPAIEKLSSNVLDSSWINISEDDSLDYSSLIGVPVASLPLAGNHTLTISGSYINVDCPILELLPTKSIEIPGNMRYLPKQFGALAGNNFTKIPSIDSTDGSNSRWSTCHENTLRLSISQPRQTKVYSLLTSFRDGKNSNREARALIWESISPEEDADVYEVLEDLEDDTRKDAPKGAQIRAGYRVSHAECNLYTTYVDVKMQCQEGSCLPYSARRSPNPPRDRNWTVFDMQYPYKDAESFVETFCSMFPEDSGQVPTVSYMIDPFNAISTKSRSHVALIPREAFETRLAHLINSQFLLSISASDVTGLFNDESARSLTTNNVTLTTMTREERVRCSIPWLAVLFFSSAVLFMIAIAAFVLRLRVLVPDVLGSLALGMLDNRCEKVMGSSVLHGEDKMTKMKDVRIMLGDVEPHAEIGRIALAAPLENSVVGRVQKDKFYW
ncbi:hypothetical protein NM208_g2074 [Fusarium decemcellulare]|uniref:Uncharacterized protein n=1 Tax=Fusarium decemcellulare TaxID=57161 RepID=A0ACC1SU58_9HYPO|nr:hypothetical protein NM208_g2074 [Fusarium decemcellulare]